MSASDQFIGTSANAPLQAFNPDPRFTESAPQFVAVINGKRYKIVEWSIDENAHGATDSGHVVLSIGDNPDFSDELFRGADDYSPTGPLVVSDDSPVFIEIWAGFPSNPSPTGLDIAQLTREFFGIVDIYTAAFTANRVTFNVRSLGAPLVDRKITRVSQNETTVQFVQAAAAQFGLKTTDANGSTVQVIGTALTVQEVLGREFIGGSNFAASLYGMKYWDLILQCALFEDVDAWVDGDTLYFMPPSLLKRVTVELAYGRDFSLSGGIEGTHAVQLNKNIDVQVHTYQRKTKISTGTRTKTLAGGGTQTTTFSKKVTSSPVFGSDQTVTQSVGADGSVTVSVTSGSGGKFTGSNSPGSETGKEKYVEFVPNLSPAAATKRALNDWRQISQHEFQLSLVLPVTKDHYGKIVRASLLRLNGIPYRRFNGLYYPRQITKGASESEPFHYKITTVNHVLPQGGV